MSVQDSEDKVLVVGSGISGMAVARQLAARRIPCQVLEAGKAIDVNPRFASMAEFRQHLQPQLAIDTAVWGYSFQGEHYNWTRVRAAGGRALLWGGWAAWPDRRSWDDAQSWGRPLSISYEHMQPLLQRAARTLNTVRLSLPSDFDVISRDLGLAVQPKLAAKGPLNERPYHPLDGYVPGDGYLTLSTGHICTRVTISNSRCTGLEYVDVHSGDVRQCRARAVVLCPSPVETTRILLESNLSLHSDAAGSVGQGLSDHIVGAYLVLTTRQPGPDNYLTNGHNVAFMPRVESPGKAYRGGFTVELHGPDALDQLEEQHLRQIGLTRQQSADYAGYLIYVIGELGPTAERFLDLDPEHRDSLERALPRFNSRWNSEDLALAQDMDRVGNEIAQSLAQQCDGRVFRLLETLSLGGAGISHEAGTCVMGTSAKQSVVGLDGQVHNVKGLFVGDASILPTALDCPPTLAIVAMALNTADGVERALSRGDA